MNDSADDKQKWWQRVRGGLKRTSASISGAITELVAKRKLDQAMLDDIEEVLIRADLGLDCAARIAAAVGEGRYDKSITADEVNAPGDQCWRGHGRADIQRSVIARRG